MNGERSGADRNGACVQLVEKELKHTVNIARNARCFYIKKKWTCRNLKKDVVGWRFLS